MHRVLKGREDPVGVVEELKCALVELLLRDDVGNAGGLYSIYADLSDIVDGYPFHCDDGTEMIAQREIRDAAWDWLSIPLNADGMKTYVDHWAARIAAFRRPTEDGHSAATLVGYKANSTWQLRPRSSLAARAGIASASAAGRASR